MIVLLRGLVIIMVCDLLWDIRIDCIRARWTGIPRAFSMPIIRMLILGLGSYNNLAWL